MLSVSLKDTIQNYFFLNPVTDFKAVLHFNQLAMIIFRKLSPLAFIFFSNSVNIWILLKI